MSKESLHRARLRMYQGLVEKKYLGSLTSAQAVEMERLGQEIDDYYEPFYAPIIEKAALARRDGNPQR